VLSFALLYLWRWWFHRDHFEHHKSHQDQGDGDNGDQRKSLLLGQFGSQNDDPMKNQYAQEYQHGLVSLKSIEDVAPEALFIYVFVDIFEMFAFGAAAIHHIDEAIHLIEEVDGKFLDGEHRAQIHNDEIELILECV
jgi:hypothetical protein